MKTITLSILIVMFVTISGTFTTLSAEEGISITLDGKTISLSGLDTEEQATMMKYLKKINAAKAEKNSVTNNIISNIPSTAEGLDEWRRLITGTIKDICTDLNITVNDFAKTPVGMGIAGLIIYKIAGKDFLSKAINIILVIPIWITIIGIIILISWYMLSYKTIYEMENDEAKTAIRVERYEWNSKEAKCAFGCMMISIGIVTTMLTLTIVF